jgi:hypothetical protein
MTTIERMRKPWSWAALLRTAVFILPAWASAVAAQKDTTGTLLRIKKVGYQASTLVLGTALTDTIPVTAMMIRAGHALATRFRRC